jgi:rhodanese-related sulfurtransferase
MKYFRNKKAIRFATAVLSVLLLLSSCVYKNDNFLSANENTANSATVTESGSSQESFADSTGSVDAVVIKDNLTVVIASASPDMPSGVLATVSAGDDASLSPGSLVTLEVAGEISYESENEVSFGYSDAEIKNEYAGVLNIGFETAFSILDELAESAYLVDVRTPEEFDSGHIDGALNIPLDGVKEGVSELTSNMYDVIILYCRSGNRSRQAAEILYNAGYKLVFNAGGISSFKGELVY